MSFFDLPIIICIENFIGNSIGHFIGAAVFGAGAAASLSFCLNISRYDIVWGAVTGGAGWLSYTIAGGETAFAYFCGALVAAIFSEIFATVIKNPATVYLVPGLLPLVPGGGMFQTMTAAVRGDASLALATGFSTLTAAGAISLAIALATSASRLVHKLFLLHKANRHTR